MKAINTQTGSVRIYFEVKGKGQASLIDICKANSGKFFICTDKGACSFLTKEEFEDFINKLEELKSK